MSPFVVFLRTDTILMHTLSLHRRPPPSADGSGLFQDICQWLYKLGYTFFFFVCNIYVYLYVFKNTQFKCICLVDWLNIVLYCFLLFFLYAKLYFVHMLLYIWISLFCGYFYTYIFPASGSSTARRCFFILYVILYTLVY